MYTHFIQNSSNFINDHSKIISSDLITNETSLLSTKPSLPVNYLPAHSNSLKNTENLINTNTVSLNVTSVTNILAVNYTTLPTR